MAAKNWGGLQKDKGREGDQRPLGEGLLRGRETRQVEELECSQGGSTEQGVLVRECVGLMCLLGRRDFMMMLNLSRVSDCLFHILRKR